MTGRPSRIVADLALSFSDAGAPCPTNAWFTAAPLRVHGAWHGAGQALRRLPASLDRPADGEQPGCRGVPDGRGPRLRARRLRGGRIRRQGAAGPRSPPRGRPVGQDRGRCGLGSGPPPPVDGRRDPDGPGARSPRRAGLVGPRGVARHERPRPAAPRGDLRVGSRTGTGPPDRTDAGGDRARSAGGQEAGAGLACRPCASRPPWRRSRAERRSAPRRERRACRSERSGGSCGEIPLRPWPLPSLSGEGRTAAAEPTRCAAENCSGPGEYAREAAAAGAWGPAARLPHLPTPSPAPPPAAARSPQGSRR